MEFAPTSAGATRYWSNGPGATAVPPAGAVGCPVEGAADGDDDCGDDGCGDDDGGDDCGDGEGFRADDPADGGGELAAGAAAAADGPEWWWVSRTSAPMPEAANTTMTTTAEIQISVRDRLGTGGYSGVAPKGPPPGAPGTAHGFAGPPDGFPY